MHKLNEYFSHQRNKTYAYTHTHTQTCTKYIPHSITEKIDFVYFKGRK